MYDQNLNAHSHLINCPWIISYFFEFSHEVGGHNKARQSELALDKMWVTNNPYL